MPKDAKKKDEPTDEVEQDADDEADQNDDCDGMAGPRGFDMWHSLKLGMYVFVIYIILMSDVFVDRVMAKASLGLVEGRSPTAYGTAVQGVVLVIGMIIVDFLGSKEVL